jgi:ABC-type amino acid transport substrate-binding protein
LIFKSHRRINRIQRQKKGEKMNARVNTRGRSILVLLAVCWTVSLCGCTTTPANPPAPSPSAPANAIKVGVSTNAPPLIYKAGGEVTGLEYDFAQELARYLQRPLHLVELEWQDQIPALLERRTDIIMAGMTITQKRAFQIDFAEPYLQSGQMALIRSSDRERYARGFADIAGQYQTIGYVKGTFGQQYVERTFEDSRKMSFNTSQKAAEALARGIIDVLIHDGPIICMLAAQNTSEGLIPIFQPLTKEYLAWGIRKEDTQLLKAANAFLSHLRQTGQLETMIQKWIPYKECTQ